MTKKEWREMIKEIYYQSLEPKFKREFKRFHPFEFYERYPYDINRLIKAIRILRFIEDNFDEDEDLTTAFNIEYFNNLIEDLEAGLTLNGKLVLDTGIVDVIEEYFDEISSYMEVDDMPEEDLEALRQTGSRNPKAEIQLSMLKIKHKKEIIIKNKSNRSLYFSVKESINIIKNKRSDIKEFSPKQPPRRKIFKGIGSIAKGTLLTAVDTTLVVGLWAPLPLSVEATSVGAVVSITTGLGDIFNGIGEIRGE